MVHVPFFDFDIPEPRLAELLPRAASAALRGATACCDAARDALFPLTTQQREAHERALIAALPREVRRSHKRILLQGNERDALAVSSELEDASYAYYRRQLRTAVAGRSDEDTDDAVWRRLVAGGDAVRDAEAAARARERAAVLDGYGVMSPSSSGEEQVVREAAVVKARPWRPAAAEGAGEEQQGRRQQRRQQRRQNADISLAGGLSSGAAGLAVGAAAVELYRLLSRGLRRRRREQERERRRRQEAAEAEQQQEAAAAAAARRRRRRGPGGVPRAPRPTMGGP
jgi:hypothetical protein